MAWQIGKLIQQERYRIEQELGKGGFGITYKVREIATNRLFALKTLNDGSQQKENFQELQVKFINETIALASCRHPKIIRVYPQMFQEDGLWCMVMDYIEARDLNSYLKQQGKLAEPEAIAIIAKIGEALSCVHQQNILHRDIKPHNILLRRSDLSPIIIDFGLARELMPELTMQRMTSNGTRFYMPVEQYQENGNCGAWTDIYALAATLYVLVATVYTQVKMNYHSECKRNISR